MLKNKRHKKFDYKHQTKRQNVFQQELNPNPLGSR
jgi:hypothetical protein